MSARVSYAPRERLIPEGVARMKLADTVVDIGCGLRPQPYVSPFLHICCEPYAEYFRHLCEYSRQCQDRIWVVLNLDWRGVVDIFPPGSVDSVFLIDVVEHLEKDQGLELLQRTTSLHPKQIVIFTPLGFMPQHHESNRDAWGLGGGVWQEHISGWTPEDLDESWEAVVCKDFHLADNLNRSLEKPFGAFWAFWSNPKSARKDEASVRGEAALWRETIMAMNRTFDRRVAQLGEDLSNVLRSHAGFEKELALLRTQIDNMPVARLLRALRFWRKRGGSE